MKKSFAAALLLAGLCAVGVSVATAGDTTEEQAKLIAKAKVSRQDAEKIARAKVPNGVIKEGEIEREHGKLIWSIDLTLANSPDIMEVNVNAMNGKVVSVERETPAQQAKEAAEDVALAKQKAAHEAKEKAEKNEKED